MIAHLYAESGNSKAEPLIEQLRNHLPTEAAALQGILAWRQGKFSESGERLATALRRLRSDPWVLDHIRVKTFDAAIRVAKADPRQAPKLLQAFGEPFAAYSADENRPRHGLRHCGGTRPYHGGAIRGVVRTTRPVVGTVPHLSSAGVPECGTSVGGPSRSRPAGIHPLRCERSGLIRIGPLMVTISSGTYLGWWTGSSAV